MNSNPEVASNPLRRAVEKLGGRTTSIFTEIGGAIILLARIFINGRFIFVDRHLYLRQAIEIGVASLPLVLLIGTFTGMVSTWQTNYTFADILPLKYIGVATFKAVMIELGPVLCGLVLAGRVGSSLAAELGTMRISEQIDALEVLAIDPVRYLAAPRFFAGLIMVPLIVILAVLMAMAGGFMVASLFMGIGFETYFGEIPVFFQMKDVRVMLVKSCTFGALICLIGTYVGINTFGGAEGVGQATIKAFVYSAILILISDYLLATMLF